MEIAEIKQQLGLSAVLAHYGLKPDKHLRLHCPFHDDKTPSLQVYYKTQSCYCFSANCVTHGKSLDVIDFVMYKEGCSKGEAIQKCKQLIGAPAATTAAPQATAANILGHMFTYFKNAVHNSKPAQAYIQSRGLDATLLEIGYNTAQFHHGNRKDDGLIEACVQVGLLSPWGTNSREGGQAYKPFAKCCIVFPLRSRGGQVAGLYFRSTVNDNDQKHFYLKDRKGLYPGYPAADTQRLILTEAIIDAATLLQQSSIAKSYSVLSCYGTNGFSEEHQAAIASLPELKEIIFAFDGDEAGSKAAVKYATQLQALYPNLLLTTLQLPAGEDINSVSASHEPDVFTGLLHHRQPVLSSVEKTTAPPTIENLDTANPYKLRYSSELAHYDVLGGIAKPLDSLKVTLVITRTSNHQKSRQKVDLYEEKQVDKLCKEVSEKLHLERAVLETDLYRLTDLLETYREQELLQPQTESLAPAAEYPLTAAERSAAEAFFKAPDLPKRLNALLETTGIIGEETNRLFLLLIAISYKMAEPLHALIQGSSGSGKTRLLKQVSDCMPVERVTKLTRISDKVLYNYPERYFEHRLLCLEDIDGLSEEAEFALRELQSNGELNSATSIKLDNGQITSGQKTVKGPIASLACTTRGELYEDNMSRVFLLAVDESAEQTARILDYQNRRAAGQIDNGQAQAAKRFIQNLVRALLPLEVVNPYAGKLHLPEEAHKIRRLNDLFLNFVKMVTLLHQYQRKKDSRGRLITEAADLDIAVHIMFESIVLKVDELDGSLRQFFEQLKTWLQEQHGEGWQKATFTLRDTRQGLRVSKTQLFRYINDLVRLEYVHVQGGHINRGFRYQVSCWDNHQGLRNRLRHALQQQLASIQVGTPGLATSL